MACSSPLGIILVLILLLSIAGPAWSGKKKGKEKGADVNSQSEDSENDRPKTQTNGTDQVSPEAPLPLNPARVNQPEWLAEQSKTVDYESLSLDPGNDTSGSPDPAVVALLDVEDELDVTPRLVVDEPEEKGVEQPKVASPKKAKASSTAEKSQPKVANAIQPNVASPKKVKAGSTAEKSGVFPSKTLKDPRQVRDQPKVASPVDSPPRPPLSERTLSMREEDRRKEKLEKARVAQLLPPPPPPPTKPQHLGDRQRSWTNRADRSQQQAEEARRTHPTNMTVSTQLQAAPRNSGSVFAQPQPRTSTAGAAVAPTVGGIVAVTLDPTSGPDPQRRASNVSRGAHAVSGTVRTPEEVENLNNEASMDRVLAAFAALEMSHGDRLPLERIADLARRLVFPPVSTVPPGNQSGTRSALQAAPTQQNPVQQVTTTMAGMQVQPCGSGMGYWVLPVNMSGDMIPELVPQPSVASPNVPPPAIPPTPPIPVGAVGRNQRTTSEMGARTRDRTLTLPVARSAVPQNPPLESVGTGTRSRSASPEANPSLGATLTEKPVISLYRVHLLATETEEQVSLGIIRPTLRLSVRMRTGAEALRGHWLEQLHERIPPSARGTLNYFRDYLSASAGPQEDDETVCLQVIEVESGFVATLRYSRGPPPFRIVSGNIMPTENLAFSSLVMRVLGDLETSYHSIRLVDDEDISMEFDYHTLNRLAGMNWVPYMHLPPTLISDLGLPRIPPGLWTIRHAEEVQDRPMSSSQAQAEDEQADLIEEARRARETSSLRGSANYSTDMSRTERKGDVVSRTEAWRHLEYWHTRASLELELANLDWNFEEQCRLEAQQRESRRSPRSASSLFRATEGDMPRVSDCRSRLCSVGHQPRSRAGECRPVSGARSHRSAAGEEDRSLSDDRRQDSRAGHHHSPWEVGQVAAGSNSQQEEPRRDRSTSTETTGSRSGSRRRHGDGKKRSRETDPSRDPGGQGDAKRQSRKRKK